LTGGFDGLQAEHARVPLADNTMHLIPNNVPDNKALLVSDVCCTAWHGNELVETNKETESVAVWGAGPVGLLAAYFAKFRGAKRVVIIDHNEWRLERARKVGVETVNLDETEVADELLKRFPDGIEKCIDCVGFRFPKSGLHKMLRAAKIETDSPEVIQDIANVCQKGGHCLDWGLLRCRQQFPDWCADGEELHHSWWPSVCSKVLGHDAAFIGERGN